MKQLIATTVVFDASAKTLKFSGIDNFNIRYLYGVINQTRETEIYSIADATLGFTALSGDLVTLTFDTTSHADDDILLVIYEVNDDFATLFRLYNSVGWMANARSSNDQMRAILEAGSTTAVTGSLTAVTTVTTVTGITQMGGQNIDTTIATNLQNLMFANCLTNNILIS